MDISMSVLSMEDPSVIKPASYLMKKQNRSAKAWNQARMPLSLYNIVLEEALANAFNKKDNQRCKIGKEIKFICRLCNSIHL